LTAVNQKLGRKFCIFPKSLDKVEKLEQRMGQTRGGSRGGDWGDRPPTT